MQRVGLVGLVLVLTFTLLLPLARAREGGAESDREVAVLYTISPGTEVFERWGHTLLCFQPASAFAEGTASNAPETHDREELLDTSCFDFGIFPRLPLSQVVLGSLRGESLFVPQQLAYQDVVGRYFYLDRTVERQVLPLELERVFELRDRLEQIVGEGEGYAYHPLTNNCSTRIRDAIDEASGGALRSGPPKPGPKSFRAFAEEGFSGHPLALIGVQLLVGASADAPTTSYQRAAFPRGLAVLVRDAMGAESTTVYQQSWTPLATSPHAGRLLLVLFGLGTGTALWFVRRRFGRGKHWFGLVRWIGIAFGGLGTWTLLVKFISDYPEFSSNWVPVVFFPLDVAIGWMNVDVRRRYIQTRLSILGVLAALSLASVVAQPLLIPALVVALPLGLLLFLEARPREEAPSVQPDPRVEPNRAADSF